MTVEQVFSALQTIFGVKLPFSCDKAPEENLDLPDTSSLLTLKLEDKKAIDANSQAHATNTIPLQTLEDFSELTSDILTEVMMSMAKGMKKMKSVAVNFGWQFY